MTTILLTVMCTDVIDKGSTSEANQLHLKTGKLLPTPVVEDFEIIGRGLCILQKTFWVNRIGEKADELVLWSETVENWTRYPTGVLIGLSQQSGSRLCSCAVSDLGLGYMDTESVVFPVTYLSVSKDLALQQLLVEWDVGKSAHDAELAMSFEIQVRRTDETTTVWTHNSSDTHLNYASITLGGLQPYTEYTARVHCGAAKHFWRWSEWSEARTIRTMESSPSGKLDIWREITPALGGRNVTLFWKQTPSFRANGRNISYEVTWEKVEDGSKPESISFSSAYNNTRIAIDNHSYRISIVAKNNVNFSLPSVLIIPRATDAFVPGVRYNFHIYGSVADRASLLEKKTGYLKELPPLRDPTVKKVELTSNAVTLSWDYHLTNESGFVRGYHVYVSPVQEDCSLKGSKKHVLPDDSVLCKYTIENPEEKTYTVKHLLPNTKYKLVVKAYTGGGETPIVNFRYIDTPFNSNMLYLLVLLVIVPSLVAALCRWKMKWVKECCCPVIPSPNKSKALSFKEFKIGSEKVLKISDCIPDMLAVDNKAEAQKFHPWSQLSSTPTADQSGGDNSSRIYPNDNEERDSAPTPTPQSHTWKPKEAVHRPWLGEVLTANREELLGQGR
ncbi:oncostatin-m-specific receptor subunit beta isoform x1 [Limosa lapponica baueri]|uniref:Oncostatin-m-specific receptor subunit beta isoform x1 n=1 Tax=Limosa lapponica baueri TaxID=1758121 RepID=A0A2I0TR03_LIMLA|nr:oncostatin-m-specific receptor subunit beta isoform x1 [Limosa lapponica baueri]